MVIRDIAVSVICHLLGIVFRLASRSSSFDTLRSILIIKPCCLGDVLMATPVIAALRQAFPRARIDFAVGGWARAMVENNPHLDELVDCGLVGSGPSASSGRGGRYSWREYFELLEYVLERSARTKVIVITGYATVEVAREALAKGAFDFIAKPFKPDDLRQVIARAAAALEA